ncbi:endo-1,4-beta-xylanase [Clostridium beijerinckii]|uniref:endo-1,4-beta-xylanase n=1 Tax=Clostridium beijerinckii TaxID=1520 RepID=UPI0022E52B34|nr:endo-1,4-beta-xylanase [Clostridium beijerinckii]
MFSKKKRLKLMSLIITGSLLSGIYTTVSCQPALADTGNTLAQTQVVKQDYQKDIPALKDVFKDYFPVGTELNPSMMDDSNPHSRFIKYQYNALVPGNFMKPDALQPTEGNFHWDDADKYVKFGEENNMILRGHTLVWHSQIPDWFFQDPTDKAKPATSEQLRSRMEKHIKTVVGRYKGKIKYWDVVNEVISDKSGLRGDDEKSKWKSIIGDIDGDGYDDDYIELAFKYAHEADPDATLIINDYGTEGSTRKREDLYNLIERMLKKGIPVGGVGLQSHISMYNPSAGQIKDDIEKFASLKKYNPKFTVQVTELDMSIYSGSNEGRKTITDDVLAQEASQYKAIFDVYKEEAKKGNLGLVMFWGGSDDDTWLDNFPVKNRPDSPLLFDRSLQAKPAYWALVDPSKVNVFKQKTSVSNGTPVIGNTLDPKWMMVKPFDVNSYISGIDGATAKVKTMWDLKNIYVFADVNDATISNNDGVDIFIDDGTGKYVKYSVKRNTDTDIVKVISTSKGYQIQAKLPLGTIQAKVGTELKFDMKVNDYDNYGILNSSVVWNDYASGGTMKPENGGALVCNPESKSVEAKRGTPVIDGNIDDIWSTANVISTDISLQGTNAAKAKVRTLWDKDYIYVLYEVTDSELDKSSKNAYEQDSVEAFIDENNARTSAYDNDDAQYRVNYDNEQSGGGSRITDKFKSATKVTDNGYIVEMAIPLYNEAVANQIIGFDAQVNDAAGGVRNGVNIWSDSTGQTWSTMSNVGNLKLVD